MGVELVLYKTTIIIEVCLNVIAIVIVLNVIIFIAL